LFVSTDSPKSFKRKGALLPMGCPWKKDMKKISAKTAMKIIERCGGNCENPKCYRKGNQLHHIFFKSQYFGKDRDSSWNVANICFECHDLVHHTGKKEGAILNHFLKRRAYLEYNGSRKTELGLYVIRAQSKC